MNLNTIVSRPDDIKDGIRVRLGPDPDTNTGLQLSLMAADNPTVSCTDSLTRVVESAGCPAGAKPTLHPQSPTSPVVVKEKGCRPCTTGEECPAAAPEPILCTPGYFNPMVGATSCTECPDGTISTPGAGAEGCTACFPGTWPNAGKDTCQLCPSGTFSNSPGVPCAPCPAGTFRDASVGDGIECNPW